MWIRFIWSGLISCLSPELLTLGHAMKIIKCYTVFCNYGFMSCLRAGFNSLKALFRNTNWIYNLHLISVNGNGAPTVKAGHIAKICL